MAGQSESRRISRRGAIAAIAGIGAAGDALAHSTSRAFAQESSMQTPTVPLRYPSVPLMKIQALQPEGEWLETTGFHTPGDGGGALYQLQRPSAQQQANDADVIALDSGLLAVLHERQAVNYRMFGALGDGENDDGVQLKLAHEYANRHQVPVINPTGEFWIRQTSGIPIRTGVQWGKSIFHLDERFNDRRVPRFVVQNDYPDQNLTEDEALRQVLIEKLKPGVQLIAELAPYANHLLIVQDAEDRIGIRAGYANHQGWPREELFYVEEEGRIIGDIAWEFENFTSVRAIPCNHSYLMIEGGGFHFSGDTPQGSAPGYHHNGIAVQRSRTIIRGQWMGLEPGQPDQSLEPRHGLYVLNNVYDVTLENIRAMPWEKGRQPPETPVQHGTYGIGGARMLHCTFRHLTAEGGWVAWGVFGTNLNKDFRLDSCRLNRVDVHFHCWNLHISNCTIGFKGISVTGGGELLVENTVRHGNHFISFRPDYGARWDGPIRIRGCTLKPSGSGRVSVLSMRPANFDYRYPIGLGTSIAIEDLRIDYAAVPEAVEPCWLMDIAAFSQAGPGNRLFFPRRLLFRDIWVEGREKGVRLLRIPDPYHYDLRQPGGGDENRMQPNCLLVCDRVQLEKTIPADPDDVESAHLALGGRDEVAYADSRALFPKLLFTDCEDVVLHLGRCAASVFFQRCTINMVHALELRGELNFADCRLQPRVARPGDRFYSLESTLGTRFTHCTVHAPIVDNQTRPELIEQIGFLKINHSLRHYHLNTALGNEVVRHFKDQGIAFAPEFVAMLTSRHELDA